MCFLTSTTSCSAAQLLSMSNNSNSASHFSVADKLNKTAQRKSVLIRQGSNHRFATVMASPLMTSASGLSNHDPSHDHDNQTSSSNANSNLTFYSGHLSSPPYADCSSPSRKS
uniref:Uncharacterized protein n=1 Tax=Lygus hesperus TaxID=30085 RepID=A0A146M964_LYGHE